VTATRVLVVDDDADMRMLMGALLEHLGATVTSVGDPAALAAVLSEPFDLALLDLVMPGSAYQDCVALLTSGAFRAPVCLLSGSGAQTLMQERERLDASGLHTVDPLTKPARLDALSTLIASLPRLAEPDRGS
jgi:CheY-like chemotaxis protein